MRVGAALVTVWRDGQGGAVLIDSGAERSPSLLRELERRGLRVKAVLCTHMHPDHTANNRALVASQRTMVPFAIAAAIYWVSCLVIEFALFAHNSGTDLTETHTVTPALAMKDEAVALPFHLKSRT